MSLSVLGAYVTKVVASAVLECVEEWEGDQWVERPTGNGSIDDLIILLLYNCRSSQLVNIYGSL